MTPKRITIHHSLTKDGSTCSWDDIYRYHVYVRPDPFDDIGYHFGVELIEKNYHILMGRMLNRQGAHCRRHNEDNIGICMVGNFDDRPIPYAQLALTVKLVAYLCDTYNIPIDQVKGDREYHPSKTCPGLCVDMNVFRKLVKNRLGGTK